MINCRCKKRVLRKINHQNYKWCISNYESHIIIRFDDNFFACIFRRNDEREKIISKGCSIST